MTFPFARSAHPSPPRDGSGAMFDRIAPRYDLLNRVISFGTDRSWRRTTARALSVSDGQRILDVATGTADLAIEISRLARADVVGLDPSEQMLAIAHRKLEALRLTDRIQLVVGSAEQLPFTEREFDGASMAFGIRNVQDRPRALGELARVLKPGGRLAILELSEPKGGLVAKLARFHVHSLVPWVGAMLSGAREYRYLEQSIATFPPVEVFVTMLTEAGFEVIATKPFSFGVAHLYLAVRRS